MLWPSASRIRASSQQTHPKGQRALAQKWLLLSHYFYWGPWPHPRAAFGQYIYPTSPPFDIVKQSRPFDQQPFSRQDALLRHGCPAPDQNPYGAASFPPIIARVRLTPTTPALSPFATGLPAFRVHRHFEELACAIKKRDFTPHRYPERRR
ncbi:uncharacterized protein EI97DRAFT_228604 [Westerdykella ornata]|uniref:Uncharacterized protein n=1 Tax=Westerdykella ornata TaxID=318751 RepID=A0A6A6JSB5_WESOR|nr:uncharacterized protein EI97DRAFT_228604 [Westerdykella ornata]KAF2279154.1 hypothetical protein EI97DRAFT_228604 [Westerdykella ornata]